MTPDPAVLEALRAHAAAEAPRECCGAVVLEGGRQAYVPCRNISPSPRSHFQAHPADLAAAEARGPVLAYAHSHVGLPPRPSQGDMRGIEDTGLPWIIACHPTGAVEVHAPTGWRAPLIGREFCHGTLDCFTLIRDYYLEELGIRLPDFAREDEWWKRGGNLYLENYAAAGFALVPDGGPRRHDVLLIHLRSPVPNHGAVYLGNGVILHHVTRRLSRREGYAGFWKHYTAAVVRHRSLC